MFLGICEDHTEDVFEGEVELFGLDGDHFDDSLPEDGAF